MPPAEVNLKLRQIKITAVAGKLTIIPIFFCLELGYLLKFSFIVTES